MSYMYSDRINSLPPYLFAAIDEGKKEAVKKGVDVIDIGVGDPDQPTPSHIVESLCEAARDTSTHTYPSYTGLITFREAASAWYSEHFGVEVEPQTEVLALIGSKEGIAHAPMAFLNAGDIALVPDPAYPVYKVGNNNPSTKPVHTQVKNDTFLSRYRFSNNTRNNNCKGIAARCACRSPCRKVKLGNSFAVFGITRELSQ
ncbi:MAG: LL-diaminopimelate aminotransferase [Candidatus Argoarchaeum ethanivorans]|uniref:LL-diaminopimelate aminotransferase n=1 Tax=Candidatus Argoarchaeum ethanivorans TaxID=2608793 RepID=A0A812A0M3_9EURY|nr:MAG: LL-diaminopimelate aminotransferase [Candidatus Argoarchaeum ethanivorans]